MAKKLQITAKKPVAAPQLKTKKMKVNPSLTANMGPAGPGMSANMASMGPGPSANMAPYQGSIGANMSQKIDMKEQEQDRLQHQQGNANAYDPEVGYFEVPVDKNGRYTDTGANVARRLKMKKGKK